MKKLMARYGFFFFIMLSYATILVIFTNLITINSPLIGAIASITYFLINGTLLGRTFFEKERLLFRSAFGLLLLIILLGLTSWAVMIIYNLDIIRFTIALLIVTTFLSIMRLKKKHTQGNLRLRTSIKWQLPRRHGIARLLYLFMIAGSFYLLVISRSTEVHTVWEVLNPLFIPMFFATTLLLLAIIFSSEKLEYKVLFTVIHSILSHSFFVIVFPAGDVGGQQMYLGRTRLVFDNVIHNGWSPTPPGNILLQIYQWCRGINFQTALSVTFARMFGVDVLWSHLFLIPLLWGTFIPVAAYMTTKAITANEKVSVLSSLLISSFPYTIFWGAISVPNSLGYIFFFYSLVFSLKYVSSNESQTSFLMVTFTLVSFLAHFLTGIMSLSLLLLGIVLKKYKDEKDISPRTAKISLLTLFIFCASLLPISLIYHNLFYHIRAYFGLGKLYGLSTGEIIQLSLLGEYIHFDIKSALVYGISPLLGLLSIVCLVIRTKKSPNKNLYIGNLFLILGFLVVLVDYRILKLFMVDIPFREERLWLFRDFLAVPFVAMAAGSVFAFLRRKKLNTLGKLTMSSIRVNVKAIAAYILIGIPLSAWVTASVYYGYPHYGPLQTTSYELEAVKYIDKTTTERYIVICDYWMIYAGEIVVGINNPRAFYFAERDFAGVKLFLRMKDDPSPDPMIEAMKRNNFTVAYFIVEEPRLGTEEFNRVVSQALQNGLGLYGIFGQGKLYVFYYTKET